MQRANPYDWNSAKPRIRLTRDGSAREATGELLKGRVVVVVGGRGMGKSVFLDQVVTDLSDRPGVRVVSLSHPDEMTASACRATLSSKLELAGGDDLEGGLAAYFEGREDEQLVLVYDELDGYALEATSNTSPNIFFNKLEVARKNLEPRLCVLAAGSVNVVRLAHEVGSDFLSRARSIHLPAFDRDHLDALAAELAAHRSLLPEGLAELVELLRVLSGGNPALAVYGLECLWEAQEPSPQALLDAFLEFRRSHNRFISGFGRSLGLGTELPGPANIWRHMLTTTGPYMRRTLWEASGSDGTDKGMLLDECLGVLEGSGVVRFRSAPTADPLHAEAVPTILANVFDGLLGEPVTAAEDLPTRLRTDLLRVLHYIRRFSADFFRSDEKKQRQLVPESVFAALLGVSLREAGWSVDRESLQGPGRTDLRLVHPDHPEHHAVVEVKIWGRNDYKSVHDQVSSYELSDTGALAVVMIGSGATDEWMGSYATTCLGGDRPPWGDTVNPLVFRTVSQAGISEDHLVVHLPRR